MRSQSLENNRNRHMDSTPTCTREIPKHLDFQLDSLLGHQEIEINLVDWLSHPPHCFGGRYNAVLGSLAYGPATYLDFMGKTVPASDIACQNETDITAECLPERIESNECSEMPLGNSPPQGAACTSGDIERCGSTYGCRIPRITVSKKLLPLTTLAGADFVKAWLQIVQFHAYSWNNELKRCDPSLRNMTYHDSLECGVLNDHDVSIPLQDLHVPGTDRAGAIPYMATELLADEYWHGEVARQVYRLELEAFIWILAFVFLGYQDKKFQRGTLVDNWMISDYNICLKHKSSFFFYDLLPKFREQCRDDFIQHWPLPHVLLALLNDLKIDIYNPFRRVPGDFNSVQGLWPRFTAQLDAITRLPSSKLTDYLSGLIAELELHNTLNLV